MRTKDVDCVLAPHITAVEHGRRITTLLLASGWRPRSSGAFGRPADAQTPDQQLPAVRLYPPGHDDWFLEMLTEPASDAQRGIRWDRVALASGEHFGLPSFEFTGISTFDPAASREGLRYARPECMALAHLLEHRAFSDQPISGTDFGGRPLLRRNKDLGRVLAIATLAGPAGVRQWPARWSDALGARRFHPGHRSSPDHNRQPTIRMPERDEEALSSVRAAAGRASMGLSRQAPTRRNPAMANRAMSRCYPSVTPAFFRFLENRLSH